MFEFKCGSCEKVHKGIPTFGYDFPIYYLDVPEAERDERCELTSDTCVIDNELFLFAAAWRFRLTAKRAFYLGRLGFIKRKEFQLI